MIWAHLPSLRFEAVRLSHRRRCSLVVNNLLGESGELLVGPRSFENCV